MRKRIAGHLTLLSLCIGHIHAETLTPKIRFYGKNVLTLQIIYVFLSEIQGGNLENYNVLEINKLMEFKEKYERVVITPVGVVVSSPILTGSIITDTNMIQSVGQELGPVYDLSSDGGIDANTEKTFSHEWETGTGI